MFTRDAFVDCPDHSPMLQSDQGTFRRVAADDERRVIPQICPGATPKDRGLPALAA